MSIGSRARPRSRCPCLLVLASLAAVAQSQTARQAFEVDLNAATKAFDNAVVTRCFGSSHAATAMRADWQRELTTVQADLGVEYVRFHGLLDDDMSVVVPSHRHHKQKTVQIRSPPARQCTFVQHQDFGDMGANVVNASSKEECCRLCYTEPTGWSTPCVAAVFQEAGNRCYFKLGSEKPVPKPGVGIWACVTDRPSAKSYQYSWLNIFTVFDFLRSINMRPIVEVSFMPELLAAYTNLTVFHYKGILSPPKSLTDWRDFVEAFGTALIDRYGLDEVKQWYFEVWNEPNCCGGYPDTGCCGPGCGNASMYGELYSNTWMGLKKADPGLRVGGPATAQLAWLDVFVEGAAAAGTPPDFVSSHLYPTDPWAYETALPKGRDDFYAAIAGAADIVEASAKKHGLAEVPPFVLTEFNCGLGMGCQDSFYSGSFVAHHALNSQGIMDKVPIQSYWTFSDIFEESGQQPQEFAGAFGTRTFNGVPKPVYRAMQLVKRLGSVAFPATATQKTPGTVNLAVTATNSSCRRLGAGCFEMLLVNHPTGPVDMKLNQTLPAVSVIVTFKGPLQGKTPASATVRRVDATHANAVPVYMAAGEPDYPNASMLAALRKASAIVEEPVTPVAGADGTWSVEIEMPAYSVATVSF